MDREREHIPRIMTQAPNSSQRRREECGGPLIPSPDLEQGLHLPWRGGSKAAPGHAPALRSLPSLPTCFSGPCPPFLAPLAPLTEPAPSTPPSLPTALRGPDPPMAMSRLLGGFHVRVIILPVTATTCGAPSGGPGTTSESHRSSIRWVF